jgi:hypothetical protein
VKVYGGWHEADNPVASIDTGIKRPTTETQVNPRYYAAVYTESVKQRVDVHFLAEGQVIF